MPKTIAKTRFALLLLAQAGAANAQGPAMAPPIDLSSEANRVCYQAILADSPTRRGLCTPDKAHPLTVIRGREVADALQSLKDGEENMRSSVANRNCASDAKCSEILLQAQGRKAIFERALQAARAKAKTHGLE